MSSEDVGSARYFGYRDGTGYWKKVSYLAHQFFTKEGSLATEQEGLSLTSHFNLGTGHAGQASTEAVERDVVEWVSMILGSVFEPQLVVLLGLNSIIKSHDVSSWWNHANGLSVDWRRPQRETELAGYRYRFREWKPRTASGKDVRLVTWPNHPSRHPFADPEVWRQSVRQYLELSP
jgi:hypothetical protein